MKAIVYHDYGSPDVLRLEELKKPLPKENEVLIKVDAASANAADGHLLRGTPFVVRFDSGLRKPRKKILGADVSGEVESIGKNVTQFQTGDEVFGDLSSCGCGSFAEYVCAPADQLVLKPTNLTIEDAAAIPMAAVTALQGLRDRGGLQSGQTVLINGASGGVGTFAVQIAKALGAEVTAVCSTSKIETVRSLGADHVIDYTQENFTEQAQRYDLILAANGNLPISAYKQALAPNGTYVCSGGSMKQIFQAMLLGSFTTMGSNQKMTGLMAKPNQADLTFVKELVEAEKVTPLIDRRYPLPQLPDAMRYLNEGRAKGKIIINIGTVQQSV